MSWGEKYQKGISWNFVLFWQKLFFLVVVWQLILFPSFFVIFEIGFLPSLLLFFTIFRKPWKDYEKTMKTLWRNHEKTIKKPGTDRKLPEKPVFCHKSTNFHELQLQNFVAFYAIPFYGPFIREKHSSGIKSNRGALKINYIFGLRYYLFCYSQLECNNNSAFYSLKPSQALMLVYGFRWKMYICFFNHPS